MEVLLSWQDIEVEDLGFSDPVYTFHPGGSF